MTGQSLVDPSRYVGTITVVGAAIAQANMPKATARPDRRGLARGAVGDFVFIDCESVKLLGRIIEVKLPDNERLTVEPAMGVPPEPNPVGRIQLLASVDHKLNALVRGLRAHPRVGDAVYLAQPELFGELAANALARADQVSINLGVLSAGNGMNLKLPPEKLFGRHCGLFGATGGGKSWTIAALLDQIKAAGGKCVLFDPTGEFAGLPSISKHYAFSDAEDGAELVHFPYTEATEEDIFALFRPSGQSQGPRLREAIRSLKLVRAVNGVAPEGVTIRRGIVEKANNARTPFFEALDEHRAAINSPLCNFQIRRLAEQVTAECVWTSDNRNPDNWGGPDQSVAHCETLVARIRTIVGTHQLSCLFETAGKSLVDVFSSFFANDTDDIIRISFRSVHFEHNTREILLNVIGRYLLSEARKGVFRSRPMIVALDEAHQFLGRTVGDEYASVRLEAFGIIAKEGRKYGLTSIMATQRPRDIPHDVLSQLGTLIVHRLTNDEDRLAVERACGDLDKNAALFIPTLAPGEAIIVGPDLPAPMPVQIHEPLVPPNSKGPDYNAFWRERKIADDMQDAPITSPTG
ncbi:ATP-binding protein [Mesorhizobium sp.]|uniref:ATP-binding protein n=1 Tax=Mesorhizobium sp. TaxID=1871066 RepID=UPI000FE8D48C|nr:ATP-binding protein [Mesorhizobium sp.]RWD71078.1 MAG: ATP-binding protein [Mesorhizobium sp.]TIV32677.1 MAG: ATP-binding protein [Mesorhizobium sp.]